jgi:hypothetical protein
MEAQMSFWVKFPHCNHDYCWINQNNGMLYLTDQDDPESRGRWRIIFSQAYVTSVLYPTKTKALKAAEEFMKGFDEPEIQPMMAVPDGYWVMPVPTKGGNND